MKPTEKTILDTLRRIVALDKVIKGQSIDLSNKKDRALVSAVTIAYGLLEQFEREKEKPAAKKKPAKKVWVYNVFGIEWDTSTWGEEQELATGMCVPDLPDEIDEIEFDHEADWDEIADLLENIYGFAPKDFAFHET